MTIRIPSYFRLVAQLTDSFQFFLFYKPSIFRITFALFKLVRNFCKTMDWRLPFSMSFQSDDGHAVYMRTTNLFYRLQGIPARPLIKPLVGEIKARDIDQRVSSSCNVPALSINSKRHPSIISPRFMRRNISRQPTANTSEPLPIDQGTRRRHNRRPLIQVPFIVGHKITGFLFLNP